MVVCRVRWPDLNCFLFQLGKIVDVVSLISLTVGQNRNKTIIFTKNFFITKSLLLYGLTRKAVQNISIEKLGTL